MQRRSQQLKKGDAAIDRAAHYLYSHLLIFCDAKMMNGHAQGGNLYVAFT